MFPEEYSHVTAAKNELRRTIHFDFVLGVFQRNMDVRILGVKGAADGNKMGRLSFQFKVEKKL